CQGNSGSRSIAVLSDVDHYLIAGQSQTFSGGLNDTPVGLVGYHQFHVFGREPMFGQQVAAGFVHLFHRILENLWTLLLNVVLALLDRLTSRRHAAAARRHLEEISSGSVDFIQESQESLA